MGFENFLDEKKKKSEDTIKCRRTELDSYALQELEIAFSQMMKKLETQLINLKDLEREYFNKYLASKAANKGHAKDYSLFLNGVWYYAKEVVEQLKTIQPLKTLSEIEARELCKFLNSLSDYLDYPSADNFTTLNKTIPLENIKNYGMAALGFTQALLGLVSTALILTFLVSCIANPLMLPASSILAFLSVGFMLAGVILGSFAAVDGGKDFVRGLGFFGVKSDAKKLVDAVNEMNQLEADDKSLPLTPDSSYGTHLYVEGLRAGAFIHY